MATEDTLNAENTARQEALRRKLEEEQLKKQQQQQTEDQDQLATSVNGRNQYDLQREQIASNAEAERKARTEALKRRLGAQNIEGGIANKAYRNLESDVYRTAAQQRGNIDIAELQAAEEREKARTAQGYAKELQSAQLGSSEKIAGMQQATSKEIAGIQTGSAERIAGMNIASNEKIQADRNLIEKQGLTLEEAKLKGYTDASGKHVMGTAEIARLEQDLNKKINDDRTLIELQGLTIEEARLKGYTDANGKHVPGTAELGLEQVGVEKGQLALEEEKLKGYETAGGTHVMGTAELGSAELTLRENQLKEEARQFDNEAEFKQYALDRQYTDAEASRVWQSLENDKDIAARKEIAFAGFDQQMLDRAETARQFDNKLDWDREAKNLDIDQVTADRIWDGVKLDKQLASAEKVAFAELSQKDRENARMAYQFDTQLEWEKEATRLQLTADEAQRAWQSGENLKAQLANERITTLEMENRITLQQMVEQAAARQITLQSLTDEKAKLSEMTAAAYYNYGQSGQKLTSGVLNPDSPEYDVVAAQAYEAGKLNIPWNEYNQRLQNTLQFQATAIASLNPDDPNLLMNIKNIINATGGGSIDEKYLAAINQKQQATGGNTTATTAKVAAAVPNTMGANIISSATKFLT